MYYQRWLRPLLFREDPESAHHAALNFLRTAVNLPGGQRLLRALSGGAFNAPGLARTLFGVNFPNPVGLAAGFDKDGVALEAWPAFGFGFIEAGTLTPRPQPGNPKPRLFRLPAQRALINRLGFNNGGATAAAAQFAKLRSQGRWPAIPVGINLGKNKATPIEDAAADYVFSLGELHEYGDYFVLNVSSPNTPGLRGLQQRPELDALLRAVQLKNLSLPKPRPMLVKIAPDLTFEEIEDILDLATRHRLAGIIATNTTLERTKVPVKYAGIDGGLSGEPLRARATEIIRFLAERTSLPIIGVGGVSDAATAREKLDAGASLVQLYTGWIYGGPGLVPAICRGLADAR